MMKYVLIPYIALGLVLSLTIGVEYTCVGDELLPKYYGSPFVFKQKSLVTSMEYYYSVSGIVLNVLVWSIPLFAIHRYTQHLNAKKAWWIGYRIVVVLLLAFTTLNIMITSVVVGPGFQKGWNYWYIDMEENAKAYQMQCEGEWSFFAE